MIEGLEALSAVERLGSMSRAATDLRITQSAVSKRIAQLQHSTGRELIKRVGRNVELTAAGLELLAQVAPLISELRSVLESGSPKVTQGRIRAGISESILDSWGARALVDCRDQLEVHAHRGPVVIDRVRAGEYAIGVVGGHASRDRSLVVEVVAEEPMVIIKSDQSKARDRDIITIESSSLTWGEIGKHSHYNVVAQLESFLAVAQLANSGWGDGLVPRGVAQTLRISTNKIETTKIKRTISLVCRKSSLQNQSFLSLYEKIKASIAKELR